MHFVLKSMDQNQIRNDLPENKAMILDSMRDLQQMHNIPSPFGDLV